MSEQALGGAVVAAVLLVTVVAIAAQLVPLVGNVIFLAGVGR